MKQASWIIKKITSKHIIPELLKKKKNKSKYKVHIFISNQRKRNNNKRNKTLKGQFLIEINRGQKTIFWKFWKMKMVYLEFYIQLKVLNKRERYFQTDTNWDNV